MTATAPHARDEGPTERQGESVRADAAPAGAAAPSRSGAAVLNAMTVDVEDYFHVEAFAGTISRDSWDSLPCRVERNTDRLLQVFADANVKATFFMLGWVAERYPELARRITGSGHELASHGYTHRRADSQTPEEFRADIRRAKALLEDVGGAPINGYRAATFSIGSKNWWAFDVLHQEGYRYSSSIYPIKHDLYGMPDCSRSAFPVARTRVTEIPLSTVRLWGRNLPCSGGGYFRLLPYRLSRWAMRHVNNADGFPCVFYLHPWEIDPDQPRQNSAPWKSRFRHYTNLDRMERRLERLLGDFAWGRMDQAFADAIPD
jgi:polysaccharide deacetylase family protein (PEP-CTERM system associated)